MSKKGEVVELPVEVKTEEAVVVDARTPEQKLAQTMDEVNALKEQMASVLAFLTDEEEEGDEEEDKTPYLACPKCGGRLMQFFVRAWMHTSGALDHVENVVHCLGCNAVMNDTALVESPTGELV